MPRRLATSLFCAAVLLFDSVPAWAQEGAASQEPPLTDPAAFDLPTLAFVFMLASFIGLGVITRVSRLLHTPLMSLTNAISAIAVVGAIAVTGHHYLSDDKPGLNYLNFLGAVALFASMTNIVSGFLLTDRMVKMFKTQAPK